jgi:hypothetical protein
MKTSSPLATDTYLPAQSPIKASSNPCVAPQASWLRQEPSIYSDALGAFRATTLHATSSVPALSASEAARVQRYQQALLRALDQRDREALQHAKAHVLRAAYHRPSANFASYGMRTALRALVWRMSGMLIQRH